MVTQRKIYTAFTAGDQTKMDRSFPSCTTEHVHQQRQNGCFRDGLQRSNKVWICCCSLMKSWLIMLFLHKICTRPIGQLVSQFYSSLGCFYLSGTTGRVVSSNTESGLASSNTDNAIAFINVCIRFTWDMSRFTAVLPTKNYKLQTFSEGYSLYTQHDDINKWKHFPRYWPFVQGIHWSSVNSPHKR